MPVEDLSRRTERERTFANPDGTWVAATWKHAANRGTATLTVRPFRKLTTAEHEQLNDEAPVLLAFLAPDTTARDIVVMPPPG